jgi:hypothetical protein
MLGPEKQDAGKQIETYQSPEVGVGMRENPWSLNDSMQEKQQMGDAQRDNERSSGK